MKKIVKIVLSLLMAMALAIQLPVNLVSVVNADGGPHFDYDLEYDVSENLTYYGLTIDDNTVELVGCFFVGSFDEETFVIPSTIDGYTVTTISRCFLVQGGFYGEGCENYELPDTFTSVVIPDTVTTIEAYAFSHCTSIESITIPSSVEEIEENAFTTSQLLYVYEGSYALQYAIDNGYNYVIIEETEAEKTFDIVCDEIHAAASYSLDELLTEEELSNDSYIEFILSVADTNDTVSDEDKSLIDSTLEEYVAIQYLDINLTKNVDGTLSDITNTSSTIMVIVDIPETLIETVGDTDGE
ncbi:MAG: leucine-rich repeat domain-containing protein [Erysipelotrichaceae bacterium]|nr:leucine-rich repeat domain-containing protein [Erysipelotrichaceae bacterium]